MRPLAGSGVDIPMVGAREMNRIIRSKIPQLTIRLLAELTARQLEMLSPSSAAGREVTAMGEKMAGPADVLKKLRSALNRGIRQDGGRLAQ